MVRIAVGGLWHETNTFSAEPTERQDFQVLDGEGILAGLNGTRTPIGGMLDAARSKPRGRQWEIVPTFFASALPSGTVTREAYAQMADHLVHRFRDARADGILLDLHGAMVAEGCEDVEADLLMRLRRDVGSAPIGCVLDLHANISGAFADTVDVVAGYDTYPHIDPYERGIEVALLLERLLAGDVRPMRAYAQPPLLTVPQSQATDRAPMADLIRRAHHAERLTGVLNVTVAAGFPYADVPFAGLSVVATADGDQALAQRIAAEIARAAWEARRGFQVQNTPPEEAVSHALESREGPVILVDVADNVGGGAPGDGTVLLDALLRQRATGAVVAITDPEAVRLARRAGEGAILRTEVGGKTDRFHGPPVPVRGRIVRLARGDFTYQGSYMTGRRVEGGWTALLDADGIQVILRERKVMPFDQEELRILGIDPARCRIIVVKAAVAWRAAYGEIARGVIAVDTPGICTANLSTLPYRRLRRPVAPLDPTLVW
jgi:microcystin degradation protein MlrC